MNTGRLENLTKAMFSILIVLFLSISFAQTGRADPPSVTVNAKIGAKLFFQAAPKQIKLAVDPVDKPVAQAGHKLIVKTNAPSYSITASYGEFSVGDYDLIGKGNLKVASVAPDDGKDTGGLVDTGDEVEILAGESGYTNNEKTEVNYKLSVDFTVPHGSGDTTVTYTASMST